MPGVLLRPLAVTVAGAVITLLTEATPRVDLFNLGLTHFLPENYFPASK